MKTIKIPLKLLLFPVAVAILYLAGFALAAESPGQSEIILLDTYYRNVTKLETSNFGRPLYLESVEQDNRMQVDVYGIFDYPFDIVAKVLDVPENWCDIASLHPNVKACTYKERAGKWLLTFYLGRKDNQPLEDTHQIIWHYREVERQQGYLDVVIFADQGPYGTKNHSMRFEALPLDGGRTFVHVRYAFSDSKALRLVAKFYFATFGRDKVGFTVTGINTDGDPVYIGGPRGAIERSAARYYFAIQSFMNTLHYPEANRFNMRINDWYNLTIACRKQLFDLEKKEYLLIKTSEHSHQVALQARIGAALQ
ncbi:hypothetical protein [uncultured Desulfobulbus sp.]|uniref:hypothetical protein n=1 Tax=uncultured Desulfobulbus sp. TaxID=239745 RepID=UPI0029C871FD|nr:hypothetical protein [uncultured Desulfobulbus sp.]